MQSEGMIFIAQRPPHPGEFLREDYIPECGLTVAKLAEKLGVSKQTVNELVRERRAVSPDMALRDSFELNCQAINQVEPLPIAAVG